LKEGSDGALSRYFYYRYFLSFQVSTNKPQLILDADILEIGELESVQKKMPNGSSLTAV